MILFIFEGEEREPQIYKTLERLYFPRKNDNIICSFGNNIYDLYNDIREYGGDGDIVSIMKERLSARGDEILVNVRSTDISEIYLFFDYDFQHSQLPLREINMRVEEMLRMFDDETGNGKLYINYPMIESIRYTKELPDFAYTSYIVNRTECHEFKKLTHEFSHYRSFDHILFKDGERPTKEKYTTIKDNWEILKMMNVSKAHQLVGGPHGMPNEKSKINQLDIFKSQKKLFVEPLESVSVLNSFPLFIYEYLK